MCLILLSLNDHPEYKLIIAANRDEFYNRKTLSARFWVDHPQILGGRDLQAGGTWMAMNRNGRISMVTNYRDPLHIDPSAPSRGHLVSNFVVSDDRPLSYLDNLVSKGNAYNGFNLIVGNPNELYYYSNHSDHVIPITPGIHGLSNHLLDTPWPKVRHGLEKMKSAMRSTVVKAEELLALMYDDRVAPDPELPDTGVGIERERALSSMFIKSAGYGSRCTTVVLVDRSNSVQFVERVYDTSKFTSTTESFSFQIQAS
jgi:uncharacterized protein with NRDE domain